MSFPYLFDGVEEIRHSSQSNGPFVGILMFRCEYIDVLYIMGGRLNTLWVNDGSPQCLFQNQRVRDRGACEFHDPVNRDYGNHVLITFVKFCIFSYVSGCKIEAFVRSQFF